MSGKTVNSAIVLLVIGNALALISDVLIKFLQAAAPVFQYAFLRCLITLALLLPFWRQLDTRKPFEGSRLHFIRGHVHLIGIVCMVYALIALPLATANAVFYAAPIMVMLRPVDLSWAALAALGSAADRASAAPKAASHQPSRTGRYTLSCRPQRSAECRRASEPPRKIELLAGLLTQRKGGLSTSITCLMLQQPLLTPEASAIAGQFTTGADHPMAGHHQS